MNIGTKMLINGELIKGEAESPDIINPATGQIVSTIPEASCMAAMKDALLRHPLGRLGEPEDIANMLANLACDRATFISGQCFTVDGGMTASSPLRPGLL